MSKKNNIILFLLILFCIFAVTAQETKIYEIDEIGLPSITPTAIIKDNKVYEVDEYGLIDIVPSQIIRENKVFDVDEYGLINLTPRYIVVIDSLKNKRR